jgi:hypothetical protein
MSTDVNYSIKGTSDVPQQVDKAKKAMISLDQTTAAINKKFSEIGKDIFLGFFAPVMLIHQAINMIGAAIEKAKQDAKDAVDFAAGIKLEEVGKGPVDPTTRFLAQQLKVDLQTKEEKQKAEVAKVEVVKAFLEQDPRGKRLAAEAGGVTMSGGRLRAIHDEAALARMENIQKTVFAMVQGDMQKALEAEKAKAAEEKAKGAKEPGMFVGENATFGVGNSPQMSILNHQVELQKQANEYLAVIAASINTPGDFTKDMSGGMTSQVNYKDYSKTV